MANPLKYGLLKHFSPQQLQLLADAKVGIAGAGGLGSNTALMLARSGLENLLIIDCDIVDATNLNRQQFWPRHLGMAKVQALGEILRELNPDINLELLDLRLDNTNTREILQSCPIWVEALDSPYAKSSFVHQALQSGKQIVSASGLCGYGGKPLSKRRFKQLTIAGDFSTASSLAPPLAPRVTQAAAIMADRVLEIILGESRI